MPATASSRRGPSYRETSHVPSQPIPIPAQRKTNYRDEASSPELIFHMSPCDAEEAPLSTSFILGDAATRFNAKFGMNYANRFGHVKAPSVNLPPYYDEPFLYSIPRLPARSPPSHARTRSEIVRSPQPKADADKLSHHSALSSSSSPLSQRYPLPSGNTPCSDTTSDLAYDPQNPLTTAFQNSLSSTTTDSRSSYQPTSPGDAPIHPLSPPASIRGWRDTMRSVRTPPARHRKSFSTATMVSGMTRTSPAEPVVSFAQADGFETMARMIKGGSRHASPHRARSPYPVARGRRSSPLRSRLKVSDQDLADSLQSTGLTEKFGLERFLAPGFARRNGLDENLDTTQEEPMERGRTRSRVRGGRRG